MSGHFDYEALEELSKGKGLNRIQYVFNKYVSELADFLKLEPLYHDILIELLDKESFTQGDSKSILDFGVERGNQNNKLIININENCKKFLPFILFREVCYSLIPNKSSEFVKICINQILEIYLNIHKIWMNNKLFNEKFEPLYPDLVFKDNQ